MPGEVAIVLHAHLPYVRHPEHPRSIEERWLHEALWETYLPLLDLLDRLAADGIAAPLSLSVSPTLATMWGDPLLRARFRDHVRRTGALAARALAGAPGRGPFAPALRHHQALLARAEATFDRHGGDVLAGFARHRREGRLHLFTTAATHAFLPGLALEPEWVAAQIAIGQRAFEALSGAAPRGFWLPECAYAPLLDEALGRAGVELSVLDAHGIALAEPPPDVVTIGGSRSALGERGPLVIPVAPVRSEAGVVYFGRDLWAGRAVWAMDGYPADPAYREHHRDLGFDAPEAELDGEVGPDGTRLATGLKLHRITGPGPEKAPYDPEAARARARAHAAEFVADRARLFAALPSHRAPSLHAPSLRAPPHRAPPHHAPPLSVAPFDAELFGHFWHEGPAFLEEVLRLLHASAARGGPAATSLLEHAARYPAEQRSQPAASTWGEGGFGATWTGARTAALWRHIHHTSAAVRRAVRAAPDARGARGEALDQAIVEALLLQSSDFAFMIHRGTTARYASARVAEHARNAARLAALALGGGEMHPEDAAWVRAERDRTPFLRDVPSAALRAPLRDA